MAAARTPELPLPKTGPRDRCVGSSRLLSASSALQLGVRKPSPSSPPLGGGSCCAPFLGARRADPAGPVRRGVLSLGMGTRQRPRPGEVLGRALRASGVGRPARAGGGGVMPPRGRLGPPELLCPRPPAALGLARGRPGGPSARPGPGGSEAPGAESVTPAVAISAPFHARAPVRAPEGWRGGRSRFSAALSARCFAPTGESNPARLSSRPPRLCRGGGTRPRGAGGPRLPAAPSARRLEPGARLWGGRESVVMNPTKP